MPVITIDIGNLDKERKARLVRELTAKASEVTQIPADSSMRWSGTISASAGSCFRRY